MEEYERKVDWSLWFGMMGMSHRRGKTESY